MILTRFLSPKVCQAGLPEQPKRTQHTKPIEYICKHVLAAAVGGSCEVLAGVQNSALVVDLLREENLPSFPLRTLHLPPGHLVPPPVLCKDRWTLLQCLEP